MVEGRPLVATGVREILDREWDIEVVGQARSPAEARRVAIATGPDVILIDGSLDEPAGTVAARRLRRDTPGAAYVVLGGHDDDASIIEAVEIGAMGHISEVAQPAELVEIIRQVAYGGDPLQDELRDRPDLVGRALGDLRDTPTIGELEPNPLTPRESEVLQLVAMGLKNREIAERLEVAEQTLKNQLRAVTRKLGAPNRTVAVMTAIRNGWLAEPEPDEAS
jgi:two-component system response regulator DegU